MLTRMLNVGRHIPRLVGYSAVYSLLLLIILLFQEHRQNIYAVMQRKSYFRKKTKKQVNLVSTHDSKLS